MTLKSPEFRALFDRDIMLKSDWYLQRLSAKATLDAKLWSSQVEYLQNFLEERTRLLASERTDLQARLALAQSELNALKQPDAWKRYEGTLGC
jgi:hypothetical protein